MIRGDGAARHASLYVARVVRGRWVAAACGAALAVLGCDAREAPSSRADRAPAPGSSLTADGLYRVSLAPESGSVPLGVIHAWVIEVVTAGGEDFVPTRVAFDGGMPQHGHGFVTAPRVTRSLGAGRYLVEGVKFHMGGDWTLRVEVAGPPGADVAVFRVQVDG